MILVVEDEADTREILVMTLELHGLPTAGVSNGQEALAYLRNQEPPKLILLDLMMPVMDGVEFRAAQLADPRVAQIPVVVVSGIHGSAQRARDLRAIDYLEKPVRALALVDCVKRHLR
jgi:CheY-like chemotaxis protein